MWKLLGYTRQWGLVALTVMASAVASCGGGGGDGTTARGITGTWTGCSVNARGGGSSQSTVTITKTGTYEVQAVSTSDHFSSTDCSGSSTSTSSQTDLVTLMDTAVDEVGASPATLRMVDTDDPTKYDWGTFERIDLDHLRITWLGTGTATAIVTPRSETLTYTRIALL